MMGPIDFPQLDLGFVGFKPGSSKPFHISLGFDLSDIENGCFWQWKCQ